MGLGFMELPTMIFCSLKNFIIAKPPLNSPLQESKSFRGQFKRPATVKQHPPAHHEGWMVSGQETAFCWIPAPLLTMVVSSVASFTT
jgi:hypothetical protein